MKHIFPILLVLFSCTREYNFSDNLTISGSDTEAPMVRSLLQSFSDSEGSHRDILVNSTGTLKGIEDLVNGNSDVANASRPMNYNERKLANKNGIYPVEVIVAHDALAIVTNLGLGVDSLSMDQLRDIFIGKIRNWSELGGPNIPILPISRKEGSGSRQFFEDRVLWDSFGGNVRFLENNEIILEEVKKHPGAIAYVGIGAVMDHHGHPSGDVWGMYLYSGDTEAVSPYERTKVRYGQYALCRPLYQYFAKQPKGLLLDFLRYELSERGQNKIETYGFFSINDEHKRRNKSLEAIL